MGTDGVNSGDFYSRKRAEMKNRYGVPGRTSSRQGAIPSIFDYNSPASSVRIDNSASEYTPAAKPAAKPAAGVQKQDSGQRRMAQTPSSNNTKMQMQQFKQLQNTANQSIDVLSSNLAAKEQQFQQLGNAIEAFKQQNQPKPEQFKKSDGSIDEKKYNSAMEKFVNDNKSKTQEYQKMQQEIMNIKTEISKLKNQSSIIGSTYTELETKSFEEDYNTAKTQREETAAKQDSKPKTIMEWLKQKSGKSKTNSRSSSGTDTGRTGNTGSKNTEELQSLDDMQFRHRQLKYNYKKLQEEVKNPSNQSEIYKKLTEKALNETRQELLAIYPKIKAAKQKAGS